MKQKIVIIDWIDSVGTSGWQRPGIPEDSDMRCQTVGILLEKTKDRVKVAQSNAYDYGYGNIMEIPIVAVTRIKNLKEV